MTSLYSDQDLAASAFQILNDLLGEIHAGRIVGWLALKTLSIFGTKHPQYLTRMAIGAIVIALYKFEDLWNHQLLILLIDQAPPRGSNLIAQLKQMKVREFRSLFIAHYSGHKKFPKPAPSKLEDLIKAQGFATDEDLFMRICLFGRRMF
jgi:hypothetical protein